MKNRIVYKKGCRKSATQQAVYEALCKSPLDVKLQGTNELPRLMIIDYYWSKSWTFNQVDLVSMVRGALEIIDAPSDVRLYTEKRAFITHPSAQLSAVPRKDPIVRSNTTTHLLHIPAKYLPEFFSPKNIESKVLLISIYEYPRFVRIFEPQPLEVSTTGHILGHILR